MLGGCATVPTGPAIPSYPGSGRADRFGVDDAACRAQAQAAFAPNDAQRANERAAGNVVGGAVIGAAIGALIGAATGDAGRGAAIGGGLGALGGGVAAADRSDATTAGMQAHYDRIYLGCMYDRGHRVPSTYAPAPRGYPVPQAGRPPSGYPPANAPPPR